MKYCFVLHYICLLRWLTFNCAVFCTLCLNDCTYVCGCRINEWSNELQTRIMWLDGWSRFEIWADWQRAIIWRRKKELHIEITAYLMRTGNILSQTCKEPWRASIICSWADVKDIYQSNQIFLYPGSLKNPSYADVKTGKN